MKQQTKVYRDGRLVAVTIEKAPTRRKHTEILDQAASLQAQQRLVFDSIIELSNEVKSLRSRLIRAEYLAKVRTRERDSARSGHRRRLEQVDALKQRNEELKLELQMIKEDIVAGAFVDDVSEPISVLEPSDGRPRAVAAKAIRK